jgi:GNAT superfamily N-acetyltransferase
MSDQRNVKYELGKEEDFFFGNKIEKVEDNFLQIMIDEYKANVYPCGENTFMIAWLSFAEFIPYSPGRVELELIATSSEDRKKGYASRLLKVICEAADKTDTTITLRTANVRKGFMGFKSFVHAMACVSKGKVSAAQLPKFYQKFGFEKNKEEGWRKEPKEGVRMIRYPKK